MRIKNKDTEKEYDVISVRVDVGDDYMDFYAPDIEVVQEEEKTPDWNQVRNQAAIAALQGLMGDKEMQENADTFAEWAVIYADALVKTLKKRKLNND